MARLEHPHILPIYAYGERDGLAYLVTPYVDGGTLQDRLLRAARPGDPAFEANLRLVQQVCAALDCAHSQGVVHRDVKPSNVLLRSADWALLSDFGLARLVEADPRLTRAGVTVGTPEYIAPEQAEGGRGDYRSDLYAVGVMLFQVLTAVYRITRRRRWGSCSTICRRRSPAQRAVCRPGAGLGRGHRSRARQAARRALPQRGRPGGRDRDVQRGSSGGEPTAPPTAAAPSGATTQQMRTPARAPALDGAAPAATAVPWAAAQAAPPRPPMATPHGRSARREPTASSPATRPRAAMFAAIALVAAGIGFLAVAGDPPARRRGAGHPSHRPRGDHPRRRAGLRRATRLPGPLALGPDVAPPAPLAGGPPRPRPGGPAEWGSDPVRGRGCPGRGWRLLRRLRRRWPRRPARRPHARLEHDRRRAPAALVASRRPG